MSIQSQNNMNRKGGSYQRLSDLLTIVFVNKEDAIDKVYRSFKVHVQIEEVKQYKGGANQSGWHSKGNKSSTTKAGKIINYWCFNPGFGYVNVIVKIYNSSILFVFFVIFI